MPKSVPGMVTSKVILQGAEGSMQRALTLRQIDADILCNFVPLNFFEISMTYMCMGATRSDHEVEYICSIKYPNIRHNCQHECEKLIHMTPTVICYIDSGKF